MKLIGFVGKKQSGKSTACNYIESKPLRVTRLNFKDALVSELEKNFPDLIQSIVSTLEKHYWEGKPWTFKRLVAEKPPLFRTLMQNYGTEVRRSDHDDYWVVQWIRAARHHDFVIVDDVRFLNEAKAVKDMGGILVRINREGLVSADTHKSELEMDSIVADTTINVATGDFEALYKELDRLI